MNMRITVYVYFLFILFSVSIKAMDEYKCKFTRDACKALDIDIEQQLIHRAIKNRGMKAVRRDIEKAQQQEFSIHLPTLLEVEMILKRRDRSRDPLVESVLSIIEYKNDQLVHIPGCYIPGEFELSWDNKNNSYLSGNTLNLGGNIKYYWIGGGREVQIKAKFWDKESLAKIISAYEK